MLSLQDQIRNYLIFFSPVPDSTAYAVDAFSVDWSGMTLYAFPPTAILNKVIRKITSDPCQVLLIAPFWPSQLWFWDLIHLSTDTPIALPLWPKLLKQPANGPFDKRIYFRDLHVWTIDTRREIDPSFSCSHWLRKFNFRRTLSPQYWAKDHNF